MENYTIKVNPKFLRSLADKFESMLEDYSEESKKNPKLEIFDSYRLSDSVQVSLSWFPSQSEPK